MKLINQQNKYLMTCAIVAIVILANTLPALAYPTAVVFAPTGDAKAAGDVGALLYYSQSFKPGFGQGPTWLGVNVGLIPRIPYGKSGLSFGGLEIGVDGFASDLYGTPGAFVKPLLNAKLQLITEAKWIPNVAIGIMGFYPFRIERSMSFAYGSVTKTIEISGRSYGRFTLGLGGVLNQPGNDPYRTSYPVFYATAPFARDSKLALIAGYESPALGPLSIAIDHIGGYSEISSTNVALNLTPIEGGTLAIGGFFGSDPNAFYGGMFAYLYLNFNVVKAFGKKKDAPPVAPVSSAPETLADRLAASPFAAHEDPHGAR
jgi:hypothetical protein